MVTIMETGQTLMETSNSNNQTLMDTSNSNIENGIQLSVVQNSEEEDDDDMSTGSIPDSDNEEFQDSAALMAAAMGDEVTAQLAAAGWQKIHINGWCPLEFILVCSQHLNGCLHQRLIWY
jgi:hypothetical protein